MFIFIIKRPGELGSTSAVALSGDTAGRCGAWAMSWSSDLEDFRKKIRINRQNKWSDNNRESKYAFSEI